MTRLVYYVSGTRADYGLMRHTLHAIAGHPDLSLGVVVVGMHLDRAFGETVKEIESDGFTIAGRFDTHETGKDGAGMSRSIGHTVVALTDLMNADRPDIVVLLGDRGEMLAGAIAALHLNIPIAHIHGGERSGTVDEPVRHAISKLSHIHFAATTASRDRLVAMGENPDLVFTVGAPGLEGLSDHAKRDRSAMANSVGLDPEKPVALFVYHPVLQEARDSGAIAEAILTALAARGIQVVAVKPNGDAGCEFVTEALERHSVGDDVRVFTHLHRSDFVNWMAVADVMIGNSSAGIIEAATFGTPVVNVGSRQNMRQRNALVIDVSNDPGAISVAIDRALQTSRGSGANVYGDGSTGPRIAGILAELPLENLLWKSNAY